MKDYWKERSKQYNKLEWAGNKDFLDIIFNVGNFRQHHSVLDVGTGTGIVANKIAPYVKEVFALDNSFDMMQQSELQDNIYFVLRDIRDIIFADNVFDRIVARMVFHHILENRNSAIKICYNYLTPGGLMILAESVPPSIDCYDEFKQIFKLKEKRIVFTVDDLFVLMKTAGFKKIKTIYHIKKEFSVKNWLDNNSLDEQIKSKIFNLHVNASDKFKEAYNMKVTVNDCLIDVKDVIMVGEKGEEE